MALASPMLDVFPHLILWTLGGVAVAAVSDPASRFVATRLTVRPVFLLSAPRSGSTLVQRVLGSSRSRDRLGAVGTAAVVPAVTAERARGRAARSPHSSRGFRSPAGATERPGRLSSRGS